MTSKSANRYPAELRERAVKMPLEREVRERRRSNDILR